MPSATLTPHEPTLTTSKSGQPTLPAGYILVRKGNPYITKHSRALTHEANRTVYTVQSPTKTQIGIAVPSTIYVHVQALNEQTSAARATAVAKKDATTRNAFEAELHKLFPYMPVDRADEVVKHTLQKRSGRVGRTTTLELSNVVALAVRAHIRHNLTGYDALLRKGVGKERARKEVQGVVDDLDRTWRGEKKEVAKEEPRGGPPKTGRGSSVRKPRHEKSVVSKEAVTGVTRIEKQRQKQKRKRKRKQETNPADRKALTQPADKKRTVLGANISSSLAQLPRRRSLRIEEQTGQAAKEHEDVMDLD